MPDHKHDEALQMALNEAAKNMQGPQQGPRQPNHARHVFGRPHDAEGYATCTRCGCSENTWTAAVMCQGLKR